VLNKIPEGVVKLGVADPLIVMVKVLSLILPKLSVALITNLLVSA
jgi:hypothetical protein